MGNTDFIANLSDDEKRYPFGNQPDIGFFNLKKLSDALADVIPVKDREYSLSLYSSLYLEHYMTLARKKLGLDNEKPIDNFLVDEFFRLVYSAKGDLTMCFRFLSEIRDPHILNKTLPLHAWALQDVANHNEQDFHSWLSTYYKRLHKNTNKNIDLARENMDRRNPRYILRTWMVEEAIQEAEKQLGSDATNGSDGGDKFQAIKTLLKVLESPFTVQSVAESKGYSSRPPTWAKDVKIGCSS